MEQHVSLNNHTGFTLIEFCVAVLIMMVGLLGLLQAVNMATIHNLGTLLRNEAISLADDRMMRAKTKVIDAASFTALVSDTGSTTNLANDSAVTNILVSRGVRSGFTNYSVALTVATAGANTKELTSRVVWRYKGNKQAHTISSIIANPNQ
jgi:type IV pilus assembly protein PilV